MIIKVSKIKLVFKKIFLHFPFQSEFQSQVLGKTILSV